HTSYYYHAYSLSFPTRRSSDLTVPAQESIMKEGWKPDQFRKILQKAIGKLRGFIQFMKEIRNGEFDARGNPLIRHDLKFDVTPRSEEHTSELQSRFDIVCRLLL